MITEAEARAAAEQFREEGYAVIRGFAAGDEIAGLQAEARAVYEKGLEHHASYRDGNLNFTILPEADFGQRYVLQAAWMSWISSVFERFRRNDSFGHLLAQILGPDVKQIAQQIHWKPPGAQVSGYRFHQDIRFRSPEDEKIAEGTVTTGLAIDRATKENGCLQVLPKSHKLGYLGLSDAGEGYLMKGLTAGEELRAVGLDPADIISLELEPGDLAVWGLLTVHGSLPNASENDRAFLIQSYTRADASERGEWAFRNGVSEPLGATPKLCKDDRLLSDPGPAYDETAWWR